MLPGRSKYTDLNLELYNGLEGNMGKQVNYFMECETFQRLSDMALTQGLSIVACNDPHKYITDVWQIPQNWYFYCFHLQTVGDLIINNYGSDEKPRWRIDEVKSPVIEAGFSCINTQCRTMTRNRIYVPTGYWNEDGVWMPKADALTKAYDKLAKVVKKMCPYTDLAKGKEYISPYCLALRQNRRFEVQ